MNFEEIKNKLESYKAEGKTMFTTSSFQSHSIVLLHILSQIDKSIPVYFINTGFHFPETLKYRDQITDLFGLNTIDVHPETPKAMQKDADGKFLFTSNPDYCCYLNKVMPLEPILAEYDIWINGVRADQSSVRKAFSVEQNGKYGVVRFHPMLDWDKRMIATYLREHQIPSHPLEEKGYFSIGCEPCTRKFDFEWSMREGRWFGMNKTECGLNTELVSSK
ncbi:MAG: phosphoadenylyl-sulfate reductase [Cytophagales bacterium]